MSAENKMAILEPIAYPQKAIMKPCSSMPTSIDLLLSTTPDSQRSLSPGESSTEYTNTPTAKLLETRSLSILRAFNNRDVATPYALHATPDFLFLHEDARGKCIPMTKRQAMACMRQVVLKNIEHYAEVMSCAVEVDEEKGQAVVWVGMRIHDKPGGFMAGTEKVTMFFWRRVDGFGGERRWMWWKHLCLSARMPFPR